MPHILVVIQMKDEPSRGKISGFQIPENRGKQWEDHLGGEKRIEIEESNENIFFSVSN